LYKSGEEVILVAGTPNLGLTGAKALAHPKIERRRRSVAEKRVMVDGWMDGWMVG
jgi:hypothetical protein